MLPGADPNAALTMQQMFENAALAFELAGDDLNIAIGDATPILDGGGGDGDDDEDEQQQQQKNQLVKKTQRFYYTYALVEHMLLFFLDKAGGTPADSDKWDGIMNQYKKSILDAHDSVTTLLGGETYAHDYDLPRTKTLSELTQDIDKAENDINLMLGEIHDNDGMFVKAADINAGSMEFKKESKHDLQEMCDTYQSAVDTMIYHLECMIEHAQGSNVRMIIRKQIEECNEKRNTSIKIIKKYSQEIDVISPSKFLTDQARKAILDIPNRYRFPMALHEMLVSPLSDGVFEYHNAQGKTWIKLVAVGNSEAVGCVLSAFDLTNTNNAEDSLMVFRKNMKSWGFEYNSNYVKGSKKGRTFEHWYHSAFVKEDKLRCRIMTYTRGKLETDVPDKQCETKSSNCKRIKVDIHVSGKGDTKVMWPCNFCSVHIEECTKKLKFGVGEKDVTKATDKISDWESKSSDTISKKNEEWESRNQVSTLLSLTIMNMN